MRKRAAVLAGILTLGLCAGCGQADAVEQVQADVDALLTEKVGFTYDQLVAEGNQGMEENYYAETDSFCVEAGDTNYCQFLCTDGVMDEDGETVTLYCDGDDWVRTCEVRVNVEGDRKTFLDNHIAEGMVRDMEEFSENHAEE